MKLNWFSPVPPTRSSIALDTAAILPALARRAEVTLWVHERKWLPGLEKHAQVRRYDINAMPWAEINAADATIYHLGNEPRYHGPIWRVNRQHPGIVVLHDLNLQDFFAAMTDMAALTSGDYLRMMEFYQPNSGRSLGEAYLAGKKSLGEVGLECPLTGAGIENALGVAVHTEAGRDAVAGLTQLPVGYVPLFAPAMAEACARVPRRGAYRIVVFGFLGANRRLHSVLQTLHLFPDRSRFHLDVYGTIAQEKAFDRAVKELGLSAHVTAHGFVTETDLNAALARSDLALNLRDPTMGEVSASQLRIWQHALPSLVTDVGWYATLSDDIVAKVRRDFELEDIQAHLRNFLARPERYREIGEKGRQYVQAHHTVEAYLDRLWELIEKTSAARTREVAFWMAGRAGVAMQPWFREGAGDVCLPGVANAIGDVFGPRLTNR
ncbi:MAG: glycosyltransferase [Chthoniobacterales bacterium]